MLATLQIAMPIHGGIMPAHAILVCLTFLFVLVGRSLSGNVAIDPDSLRNVSELISTKGYPVEEYEVITSDGYVIGIQRIPRGKNESSDGTVTNKTTILLQHGMLGSSADYVLNFPNQSLGFLLADAGYDVWLGNARGNIYTSNMKLSRDDRRFWDFSIDEMASEDLPSIIDTILKITGKEKLQYVGWSQGALQMFALLSEKPEYNKKSRMAVYFNHNPSGTSVNDILHLAQLIRCNCSRKFDYGIIKNLAKYGKSKPPEYELSHVEVPVAIYWSKGDWFAVEKDVARLRDGLSNVVEYYQVPDEQFTHYDFSWGINAEPILFRQMMSVMAKYQT
ncbi:gastric triacylglycerol lipase-like [Ixodes scapularis]|uniref:gastric triacylglycerol lipase-like n=1 Tax=Ixodes scapularis TaxID=6945 RepID=UPI001C38D150|nr:gastric triacylglycerol lipase-like [Ixodes scapularis]